MEDGKYWIDDDGYIAHGKEDEYIPVSGQVSPLHVDPLSTIIHSQPSLFVALKMLWQEVHEAWDENRHVKFTAAEVCQIDNAIEEATS